MGTRTLQRLGLVVVLLGALAPAAHGATFTVTTTAEPGLVVIGDGCSTPCTLREAMFEANFGPGADTIAFAIATGRQVIPFSDPLPAITAPVILDGSSQPGITNGDIQFDPSGTAATQPTIDVQSSNVTVRGFAFGLTNAVGLRIGASGTAFTGVWINRNIFGVSPTDFVTPTGITSGLEVGGSDVALIGNNGDGVNDGLEANVFGGAGVAGIRLVDGARFTSINGNFIGLSELGPAPNALGILIDGAVSDAGIGAFAPSLSNVIANNVGDGIRAVVGKGGEFPTWELGQARFGDNGGLAIDLLGDGVTPNDSGGLDGDVGPNGLLDHPTLVTAEPNGSGGARLRGTFSAAPSDSFVQVWRSTACDASGFGEGTTYVGTFDHVNSPSGTTAFDVVVPGLPDGTFVTLTNTVAARTSEMSACRKVEALPPAPTPTPTPTPTATPSSTPTATPTPAPTATPTTPTGPTGPTTTGAGATTFADPTSQASDLALACAKTRIVLIDVVRLGARRVLVSGAATDAFRGKRLTIKLDGKTVGRATVDGTGLFEAEVAAPKTARQSKTARYTASLAAASSPALKLDRRMIVSGVTVGSQVTIRGRVVLPLARPARPIVLQRQTSCTTFEAAGTAKVRSDGTFTARVALPPAPLKAAVYRARTAVPVKAGRATLNPTFTLPRAVDVR